MEPHAHARPGRDAPGSDPLRGRVLEGRYRIGPRIARGGMASVYEALDLRLDRTVAVKVMHAGLGDGDADRDFAERFVREARSAARLSHPNVVAVYDQGDDDGTVFLAMELVPGHTLRDVITKEAPMAPGKALALMEPVVSALAAAHRAGLVHRDVKPENVLIADDGRVKVADFGLAKAVSADTQHTATQGVLIGTVSYLAPELVVDGRADARADVYAVGVVLYELLTGVKPHEGESPIQVAYKHVHHDVPPPSERVPGLPAYVDALVARATARDRGLRPADAGVLLHQLHRVSHALADGVREDPELVTDLAPMNATGVLDVDELREGLRTGTSPETWDQSELDALLAADDQEGHDGHDGDGHDDHEAPPTPEATTRLPVAGPPAPPRRPARPPRPDVAPAARPRRRRRGAVLLVLGLVLALAVGGGAFWFGFARYTEAPRVLDLTEADAVAELEAAGLEVDYADPVYDNEHPAGTVVGADPGGGERVLSGDTVTLTLSLGELRVPKVRGLTEDAAQDALVERQLEFGESTDRYSETVPQGTVLTSRPRPGTMLEPGEQVDLVVSAGRRPVKVGDWVGKQLDDASAKLEERGLVPVVDSEEFSDSVPEGEIISQDPSGGTLFRDDEVRFVVSKGPELVTVPDVARYGVEAAEQALEDAGFDVVVERNPVFYAGLGFAVRTDPEGGEKAPKGSTITLFVV